MVKPGKENEHSYDDDGNGAVRVLRTYQRRAGDESLWRGEGRGGGYTFLLCVKACEELIYFECESNSCLFTMKHREERSTASGFNFHVACQHNSHARSEWGKRAART